MKLAIDDPELIEHAGKSLSDIAALFRGRRILDMSMPHYEEVHPPTPDEASSVHSSKQPTVHKFPKLMLHLERLQDRGV